MVNSIPQKRASIPQKRVFEQYFEIMRIIVKQLELLRNNHGFREKSKFIVFPQDWNSIPQNEERIPQNQEKFITENRC
jgi:hypothetical protein